MATTKKITMKQFNGTDYDTLYPKTVAAQIDDVYSKDETYPKSQLYTQSQLYTRQQILSDATKTLYGLGTGAVPDDAFQKLGGLRAVIHVFARAGASVSMTKGGKTFTATADSNGSAYLYPSEFGVWTVTAGSIRKTINIDANAVFYLAMSDLGSLSWSQVSTISKMGFASTQFHIGDEKTLTVNGVNYTAIIIGFDHDTPVDIVTYGRDKAGITFQLKNCLNTTYKMNTDPNIGNKSGWKNCSMRTSTMVTLLSQLASDLKNAIVKVKKPNYSTSLSNAVEATEDSLFLLSEAEIFGPTRYPKSQGQEGSQYEYYQYGNSRVKTVNESASNWWERSPYSSGGEGFCCVTSNGGDDYANSGNWLGVAFGFCI